MITITSLHWPVPSRIVVDHLITQSGAADAAKPSAGRSPNVWRGWRRRLLCWFSTAPAVLPRPLTTTAWPGTFIASAAASEGPGQRPLFAVFLARAGSVAQLKGPAGRGAVAVGFVRDRLRGSLRTEHLSHRETVETSPLPQTTDHVDRLVQSRPGIRAAVTLSHRDSVTAARSELVVAVTRNHRTMDRKVA